MPRKKSDGEIEKIDSSEVEVINANELVVKKSKELIYSKYATSTVFATQLVNIATTRLEKETDGTISARISPNEIREILQTDDKSNIYRRLKSAADELTGGTTAKNIGIEDGNGNFKFFALVTNADYINGEFKITFNKEMQYHLLDLEKRGMNYTTYELANTIGMRSPHSIRLYELLKSEAYKIRGGASAVEKSFGISELRFMLGIDELTTKMKQAKDKGASWDELREMIPPEQQPYFEWRSFRKNVLEKAKSELGDNSDITFTYTCERKGRGGKISRIIFTIVKNKQRNRIKALKDKESKIAKVNENHQYKFGDLFGDIPDALKEYEGHNKLTKKDLFTLFREAEGDEQRVIDAISYTDTKSPRDYMAYLVSAVRENYKPGVEVLDGSAEKAEAINNIMKAVEEKKDELDASIWNKMKARDDFFGFMDYLDGKGYSLEIIEEFYPVTERVQLFMKWKKENNK